MKKLLMLALCLVLTLYGASALADPQPGYEWKEDNLTYTLLEDDTWAVTGCEQDALSAKILSELDSRPVTAVKGAFAKCRDLTEVSIPEGIALIDKMSFDLCIRLSHIRLPASLTQITGNPFSSCGSLTDIEVAPGNPVLEVVDGALFSKPDQRLICYPGGLTAEEYAVPEGTRVIGDCAFKAEGDGASSGLLKRIVIPEGVTVVGDAAFFSAGLDSIELPESLTVIGLNAFKGNSADTLNLSKNLAYIAGNDYSDEDPLPAMFDSDLLVEPYSFAHAYCVENDIKHVVRGSEAAGDWLPATVVNCDEWISLRTEASTQSTRLIQIPLGAAVEVQRSDGEFMPCRYAGQTGYALAEYLELSPSGASTTADYRAGEEKTVDNLTYTMQKDGAWAVSECEHEAVSANILPVLDGRPVTAILKGAFGDCWDLTEVTIPEGITFIGTAAFGWCYTLPHIRLPASLTLVPGNPFPSCGGLKDIEVAPGNPVLEVVDGALFSKIDQRLICYPAGLTAKEYTVPEGTRVIGNDAFYLEGEDGCGAPWLLKRVVIPEGVVAIGDCAFEATCLDSIELPESLVAVGWRAFWSNYLDRVRLSKNVAYIVTDKLGYDEFPLPYDAIALVEPNSYAHAFCAANDLSYAVPGSGDPEETWRTATVVNCDEWISLRAEASTKSECLVQIPLGAQVEVQLAAGEFYPCRYQGQTGYALARYLFLDN